GLITPSLHEMVHVAREMEREGFELPLLIGGATTSKKHTAVKIAPEYSGPVVHVLDASRAVGVVSNLVSGELRGSFAQDVRLEYDGIRSAYGSREGPELFSLAEARARGYTADPQTAQVVRPRQLGIQVLEDYDLEELRGRIDWSPFFTAWEMPGSYPKIFEHARRGEEARRLFDDANRALDEIIANRTLRARGVFGIWPANRSG